MNPAERARKSNDAQVLTMGARVIAPQAAEVVLEHWLASEFEGGFRADRASPLPEPPLSPRQVYRAMLVLGRRSAGTTDQHQR